MNLDMKPETPDNGTENRIVTRADFDGIVCAVLLYDVLEIRNPVKWVEPNQMQRGLVDVQSGDIIANLPYHSKCAMWFDHHYSNRIDIPFKGEYRIAPSAAGVVFSYFRDRFKRDFTELVKAADKIDSADLTYDEVVHPEKFPYVLLSMTISGHDSAEEPYWNQLVALFGRNEIQTIMNLPDIQERCRNVIHANEKLKELLLAHTVVEEHISITDFRPLEKAPTGNRFLVYSLFPETVVSMKIRYDDWDRQKVVVSVGHSIFNRNCQVNVGKMLSAFNGGGHKGAGACSFYRQYADEFIPRIIAILKKNEPD